MSRANYASNNSRPDSDQKKAEGGLQRTRNSMHRQHPWEEAHEQNHCRRFGGDADADADADAAARRKKKNRANTLASEVRRRLLASIRTLEQTLLLEGPSSSSPCTRKLGILLSGGVDSCAILAACQASQANLVAAVTVSIQAEPDGENNNRDDQGPSLLRTPPQDELYACEAVRLYNTNINNAMTSPHPKLLEHSIVRLSPAQLIEHYTKPTIAALHVWGYMDTRNSLIISAGLHECSKLGITDILVGYVLFLVFPFFSYFPSERVVPNRLVFSSILIYSISLSFILCSAVLFYFLSVFYMVLIVFVFVLSYHGHTHTHTKPK